jgi:hypothetical protein
MLGSLKIHVDRWLNYQGRSTATYIYPQTEDVPFALKEGQTILGVHDTRKTMRFHIGSNVSNDKNYESYDSP